jgi:hypothetical protein
MPMKTMLRMRLMLLACTSCSRISPQVRLPLRPMVPTGEHQQQRARSGAELQCPRARPWGSRPGVLVLRGLHARQQPSPTCGAEGAAHLAAHLRGDAQRGALVVRHDHRLHLHAVLQLHQQLGGAAVRRRCERRRPRARVSSSLAERRGRDLRAGASCAPGRLQRPTLAAEHRAGGLGEAGIQRRCRRFGQVWHVRPAVIRVPYEVAARNKKGRGV